MGSLIKFTLMVAVLGSSTCFAWGPFSRRAPAVKRLIEVDPLKKDKSQVLMGDDLFYIDDGGLYRENRLSGVSVKVSSFTKGRILKISQFKNLVLVLDKSGRISFWTFDAQKGEWKAGLIPTQDSRGVYTKESWQYYFDDLDYKLSEITDFVALENEVLALGANEKVYALTAKQPKIETQALNYFVGSRRYGVFLDIQVPSEAGQIFALNATNIEGAVAIGKTTSETQTLGVAIMSDTTVKFLNGKTTCEVDLKIRTPEASEAKR